MKAKIKPLEGKYYGTKIVIVTDNKHEYNFKLWNSGDGTPSQRELKLSGYTLKQWRNNALVDNGWNGMSPIREIDITSDGHFESQETYRLARKIVDLINKG